MEYFLEHIAKHLYSKYGSRLNTQCLVFPNRRAGLFFLKYLAAELYHPVWTPAIMTINDLFRSLSKLQPAENEILLFELYKVYRAVKKSIENFDDFYFWGDMLLNDFDDVDKYLVDASKLFRNVQDIREIDQQFGGLSDEQIKIIKQFWINFNPEKITDQKAGFKSIWSVLNDLYEGFRKSLKEKGIAYEGMIFRDVIEDAGRENSAGAGWELVHFVGFNALNECEKSLMTRLKKEGRARFYWDFDNSYIRGSKLNSAGHFLRQNIKIFGNDMPREWSYDTMLSDGSASVKRRIIDTSSDVAQVKLIPELIREMPGLTPENAHETAVILADESLLIPVLTSLPEDIRDINITMGYPLRHTSVYTLVKNLLELQRNAMVQDGIILFSYRDVIRILKNSLVTGLMNESDNKIIKEIAGNNMVRIPSDRFMQSEKLAMIFRKPSSPVMISDYLKSVLLLIVSNDADSEDEQGSDSVQRNIRNEFIYRIVLSINKLDSAAGNPDITFTVNTWISLLDRLLRSQSVPFSGEPLSGIQIMGLLETRTLDFKNLVLLSVNEGILPAATAESSFIPFSLREAFGLPSVNHRESVYAYHFYRLLQRAQNVTFIYNSNPEGLRSGEMSRFLQQMKYEPLLKPEFLNLSFEIRNRGTVSEEIERTEEHQLQLHSRFSSGDGNKILSPTAINMWLNCRMRFYYRYVCGLKEPEGIIEEIDPAILGILLHDTMKNLYQGFAGEIINTAAIDSILYDRQAVSAYLSRTMRELYSRENNAVVAGNELIVREVLIIYIKRILEADKMSAPFTVLDLERSVSFPVTIGEGENVLEIIVGGKIDRIDKKDDVIRIVDYKSGSITDSISSTGDLFTDDRKRDYDGWLQTLLYCEGYISEKTGARVRPSVYKVKKTPGEQWTDRLLIKKSKGEEAPVNDYNAVRQEFMEGLRLVLGIIFKSDESFFMTSDAWNKCPYCPYHVLCMR